MDFDFLFKLILTASFFGVSICLCIKWVVEAYLDYLQVTTGITVMQTITQQSEDIDNDPTAY